MRWWQEARIYELYIDAFAGDINRLIAKLDYFTTLGINALHILPHYPSPMADDGYDVADYRAVRPELGTLSDFEELVRQAHSRGIRIIIECVLNHVSEMHPWFVEARSSSTNPRRDWFLWSTDRPTLGRNAFPDIKDSNWIPNPATTDYYYATFYPQQPNLNWDNPQVLEAMLANMDFWAQRGVDGFRLDAIPHIIKRPHGIDPLPEAHALIKRIRAHLDATYGGDIMLLAEANTPVDTLMTFFGDGDECHMAYHFPLTVDMFVALMTGDTTRLDAVLASSANIPPDCAWATFLRNHDEIALSLASEQDHARLLDFLDPARRYSFKKGRDAAVRLGTIFEGQPERIVEAFELLLRLPGTPVMYYGEEIGMKNLPLIDGIIDSRSYVRGPFDWDEAGRQMQDPASLFNRIARLMKPTQDFAAPLATLKV